MEGEKVPSEMHSHMIQPLISDRGSYYAAIELDEINDLEATINNIKQELNPNALWNFHSCNMCPYKTKSYSIIKNHLKRHRVTRTSKSFKCATSVKRYSCSNCNYKTSLQVSLRKHVEVSHRRTVEIKVESEESPLVSVNFNLMKDTTLLKSYTCKSCNFKTYSQLVYINHYTKCPLADSSFLQWHRSHNILQEHVRVKRPNLDGKKCNRKPVRYSCSHCKYFSKNRRLLRTHLALNHGYVGAYRNCFSCKLCPFKSRWKTGLWRHVNSKHPTFEDEEWHNCQQCPYRSMWAVNLEKHLQKRHSAAFECEMCDFRCKGSRRLKRHLEAHAEERKLKCELCPYATEEESDLKEHIVGRHVAAETVVCFRCQLCAYRTIEEEELRGHVLEKHVQPQSAGRFKCELCLHKFRWKTDLKKHILDEHIL